jgi:hypothetical protein
VVAVRRSAITAAWILAGGLLLATGLAACETDAVADRLYRTAAPVSRPAPTPPTRLELDEYIEVDADTERILDVTLGEIALNHVRHIESAFPSRLAFTQREADTAEWIVSELIAIGFNEGTVEVQEFSITDAFGSPSLAAATLPEETEENPRVDGSQNIIARLPGSAPNAGLIVVGAHYDSTDTPGAGDNASGVGLLLEVAWRLMGQDLPFDVEFVFFGAEEPGFFGSEFFVNSLDEQAREEIVLMVNVDSLFDSDVLRFAAGLLDQEPEEESPGEDDVDETSDEYEEERLSEAIQTYVTLALAEAAQAVDIGLVELPGGVFAPTDSLPFLYAGVPVLLLTAADTLIIEQPSLYDGLRDLGLLERAEGSLADTPDDNFAALDAMFPGRMQHSLYVFGTFLERVLLGAW